MHPNLNVLYAQYFSRETFMVIPLGIKALLFDMDGVLFNTEDLAHDIFASFASEFGKEFTEDDHKAIMGTAQIFWSSYFVSRWNLPMKKEQFASFFWERLEKEAEYRLEMMPGAADCLQYARKKSYKIALVTSSPRRIVETKLKRFNIFDLFDAVVTGDEIPRGKPNPDPYLIAMDRLNVKKNECAVIEDAISGVRAGKLAGCYVIAVPTRHADGLNYSEADILISDLGQIGR